MFPFNTKLKSLAASALAALAVFAALAPSASAATSPQATRALEWMRTQQQPDGSFPGFGAGSTVDALLAIIASGEAPGSFSKSGKTAVDFLHGKASELAKTPGGAGKLLIAVSALGLDPASFGGANLFEAIGVNYPAEGHYGKDAIGHAFAMLGLHAAGRALPPKAAIYLQSVQNEDGGWAFTGEVKPGGSDTNTTAVAVQALLAAGLPTDDPVLKRAAAYLKSQANADGGYPYQQGGQYGSDSDANSTAYVAQALIALGKDASKAQAFLLTLQNKSGAFAFQKSQPDDNGGATYQAIPALLGATLLQPKGGPAVVATQQPAGQAAAPTPATAPAGMPRTGSPAVPVLAGLAALATTTLLGGMALRRATQHS